MVEFERPHDDWIITQLESWGAEIKNDLDNVGGGRAIDFVPPFPGDPPIWSSIVIEDGVVVKATIRYGVLESPPGVPHHSYDKEQIIRLSDLSQELTYKGSPTMVVDYGDTHWPPRPHLRMNPMSFDDEISDYVDRGNGSPMEQDEFISVMKDFGELIKEEYEGEWDEER